VRPVLAAICVAVGVYLGWRVMRRMKVA